MQKIGASVTVAARSEADLAWACTKGFATVSIGGAGESNINMLSNGFDVIFNTVPAWLFGREFLEAVDKRTFIIDLASAPGGVDVVRQGFPKVICLSFGKYAWTVPEMLRVRYRPLQTPEKNLDNGEFMTRFAMCGSYHSLCRAETD